MVTQQMRETPIKKDLKENEEFFKLHAGLGTSFDIGVRKLLILDYKVDMYFLNGLCDTNYITQILRNLTSITEKEKVNEDKFKDILENRIVNQSVEKIKTLDKAVDQLLAGLIIFIIEGMETGFIVDVRSYPGRQPEEPDIEKIVRGARDGFVENIIVNTGLIRRRIKDERLRYKLIQIGERSKTDICIAYVEDVADPGLVGKIEKQLEEISIDGITMADKTIEEFLVKQSYNPYPLVRYTERPDVAANHLLEGHVLVLVDTSPSVIITPTTFFHHVQHAEEYRQAPSIGTFLRWVRFLGILASMFLLPLWFLFVLEPSLLPNNIDYIGPTEKSNIPIVVQIFLADFGLEFLRMAAIHTPTSLSTAMGLIAAALIGQIAIDVGLFVPEVILYVAVAGIGTFATPSYELGVANKMVRLILLIAVAIFKLEGFVIGCTVYIILMARIRSLQTPYLWPFLPFNAKALWQIIIRTSVPGAKLRPSIVHPQNVKKQPS
ncbi:spore germination protein [Metabacillus malikii]|uniref:Stage V sporulation protein AF n=1 Tax=Metabacillus malikii TaxID=1504265 RepID=A0ABT9ZMR4_9BACI|nr:spore germination protein [Metabacillus malikii]MDQ0233573.1 stage V sporulation protein AF [Metabacillus malikii]